jgi:hypothetical protein
MTWFKRHRAVAFVLGFVLAAAVGAAAAFVIYSGLTGSGGSKASGTTSTIGALQLTPNNSVVVNTVDNNGGKGDIGFDVSNATGNPVTIASASVAAIHVSGGVDPNQCNDPAQLSKLSANVSALVGRSYQPGSTTGQLLPNAVSATPDWTTACQGATITVDLTGTTN